MKTQIEVNSLEELRNHLSKVHNNIKDIEFEAYGLDERVGYLYTVNINTTVDSTFYPVGFSDGTFKEYDYSSLLGKKRIIKLDSNKLDMTPWLNINEYFKNERD